MSEELKEVKAQPSVISILAFCMGGVALGAVLFGGNKNVKDPVTTIEIVRLVNAADQAKAEAQEATSLLEKANGRIQTLEKAMHARMQEMAGLAKRLEGVAQNHNALVGGMKQEQAGDKRSFLLMERALMRLHGKPEWAGAVSAVQVEIAEEAKRIAEEAKKAEEKKAPEPEKKEKPKPEDTEEPEGEEADTEEVKE